MTVAHPEELAGLDLYEVWTSTDELTDRFDPFLLTHRMAAYRSMIGATGASGLFGADNRRNPLWGHVAPSHAHQSRPRRRGGAARRGVQPEAGERRRA